MYLFLLHHHHIRSICLTLCATGHPFCYALDSLDESNGYFKTRSAYFKRVECDGSPQICKRFASKEEVNWVDLLNSHCLTQSDYSSPPEESNQGKDAQGYKCSPNATCRGEEVVRQCYCNKCCVGDGETCTLCRDCHEAYENGQIINGVYTILPSGWPGSSFDVYCDMTTAGGGWTVFQRRTDGNTDFYQTWDTYRYGFGSFDADFWLGNEQLHYLTNQKNYKLRVDLVTSGGSSKYEEYALFRINDNDNRFRLENLGSQSGTAGNGMRFSEGRYFSTYDRDNDECKNHNCAQRHRGAWWFANMWCTECFHRGCDHFQYSSSCNTQCTEANLNGNHSGGNGSNVFWDAGPQNFCNLSFVEMKIRPT